MASVTNGIPSSLDAFFSPRHVALVGASDRSAWSRMVAASFDDYGHIGKRFAVNRNGNEAHGLPGFTRISDIPETVDTAFIYVPADAVAGALRDAAAAGVRNAVILSSGFAEAGEQGQRLQDELVAIAHECGITMLGPNSLGFANFTSQSFCSSMPNRKPVLAGHLGIVSQSGAIAVEIAKWAHARRIGPSLLCSTGNEAQIGIADVVDHLIDDDATRAIAVYVEGVNDPARFMEAARRARSARKAIVVLKIGRGEVSNAVVRAHTGTLAGDDKAFDAMCDRFGVIRVNSIEELITTADLLGRTGPIDPPSIGAASISGGACSMYADLAEIYGLAMPPYSDKTRSELAAILPGFASSLNPLDVTGALVGDPGRWSDVIRTLAADGTTGLTVTIYGMPNTLDERLSLEPTFKAIAKGYEAAGTQPVIMNFSVQDCHEAQTELRQELGLHTVLPNIELGVLALAHLVRWSRSFLTEASATDDFPALESPANRPSSERQVLQYLEACGVPVIPAKLARSSEEAVEAAEEFGGPVVLKIASPDIAHKTEAGGVKLGLQGTDIVQCAYDDIIAAALAYAPDARVDGVLVSPMRPAATELIVGVLRDPQWGPALLVGLGGIFTEVMQDSELALLPVSRNDVKKMLGQLRGAKMLEGFRGSRPTDLDRLADVIVSIGNAALTLGSGLETLEVNPLRVDGDEIECLDGLAIYREQ